MLMLSFRYPTSCPTNAHALLTKLYSSLLARRDEIRPAGIGPAHIPLRVRALLHIENGAPDIVDVVTALEVGDKRPQGDDLAPRLQIEKHAHQVIVELRRKGFVVDEHHVGALEGVVDDGVLAKVAALKMHLARPDAPEHAPGPKLFSLRLGEITGVVHHLAAPAFASNLQRRLQTDVAHAGPQVDKHLQFAIDIVCTILVLGQELHLGGHCSVIDLVENEGDEVAGQFMHVVEILGNDAVLDEAEKRLVVLV
ncbi:hypothetical protein TOPH_06266 [Tolypocladium ophioglossoides CBS 100239]|uniref:Uncharacterized protein n=1 Tax=Tolypocladium ophioglossoides (strain CBS 100239) TaxID=1163406 RepID=A0A0L0N4N1_TOLOC|nr:hypothetical protein TOPH_06266 [Tolypocladium ophioglossoides CBS 100239]